MKQKFPFSVSVLSVAYQEHAAPAVRPEGGCGRLGNMTDSPCGAGGSCGSEANLFSGLSTLERPFIGRDSGGIEDHTVPQTVPSLVCLKVPFLLVE